MMPFSEKKDDTDSDSESLNTMPNQLRSVLDEFREQWQKELKTSPKHKGNEASSQVQYKKVDLKEQLPDELKAMNYYTQAVELERSGKVYDALIYYRKALQIDSGIDLKFHEIIQKSQIKQNIEKHVVYDSNINLEPLTFTSNEEDLTNVNLYERFHNELTCNQYFLKKNFDDTVINPNKKHIGDLPLEIIQYILRWVISAHLDIKSLEQFSATCKGFYLCGRDNELWKMICNKVWGYNTGLISDQHFSSWREMFINREKLHFDGCYISKTKYLRYGENNFQDQFYRPMQIIEYYRYFRFLPNGDVLMWTTPEEPFMAVSKLKNINQIRPEYLKGRYSLHDDIVAIKIIKTTKHYYSTTSKRKNIHSNESDESYTYYINFKIKNKTKKRSYQLHWINYSIIQVKNKHEMTTNFELSTAKYPPLFFSRVKSYHLEAEEPLQ